MRMMLLLSELRVLLELMLKVPNGFSKVLLRILHESHNLALLKRGRYHVAPVHLLGQV